MPKIPNAYYRTSIKALVLDADNKFLLTKDESEKWDLPGGGLDWGEDPRVCIAREIQEEMSIETSFVAEHPSYFVASLSHHLEPRWINNVIYIVKLKNLDFVPSDECIEIGFFSGEEARELDLFPNVTKFLELYNPENHTDIS